MRSTTLSRPSECPLWLARGWGAPVALCAPLSAAQLWTHGIDGCRATGSQGKGETTDTPELVHWHGLMIPSDVDGAAEEGSPYIPPHSMRRIAFLPKPSGFRFYHTPIVRRDDLSRGTYSGQAGPLQKTSSRLPSTMVNFRGPLLRFKEGKRVTVDIHNDTDTPELVHWHGLMIPSDGASSTSPVPMRRV